MRTRFFVGLLLVSLWVMAITSRGAVVKAFRAKESPVLTVTGRVVASRVIDGVCHLYFGQDPNQSLVAVIPAEHRSKFSGRPESSYRNRHVQVSGSMREKQGRVEILLSHPDQIAIIKADASTDSVMPDRGSLRLETRMSRLEADLNDMKQRLARSERSESTRPAEAPAWQHMLQAELGNLMQHINSLNRRVRDLEDEVDQLARALVIERRGGR